MTAATSVWLFQSVHAVGLSVWCGMAAINNLQAFRGSQGAVAATMSMAPLREAPSIATPLLARAIASSTVHRMARCCWCWRCRSSPPSPASSAATR